MNFVDGRSSTWKTTASAVASEAVEVQPGDRAQPLARIADARDAPAPLGDARPHRALEDRDEQVVLAAEVEIDGAGGDAGGARDVGDLGVEEAARGEDVDGGAQDGVPLVGAAWRGGGRGRRRLEPGSLNECSFSARRLSSRNS